MKIKLIEQNLACTCHQAKGLYLLLHEYLAEIGGCDEESGLCIKCQKPELNEVFNGENAILSIRNYVTEMESQGKCAHEFDSPRGGIRVVDEANFEFLADNSPIGSTTVIIALIVGTTIFIAFFTFGAVMFQKKRRANKKDSDSSTEVSGKSVAGEDEGEKIPDNQNE